MSSIFPIPSLSGTLSSGGKLQGTMSAKGGLSGGLSNDVVHGSYEDLINKPQINEVELVGNLTFADLGLSAVTEQEIDEIIFGGD